MAYKLKPGHETVETGIRRIAGEEFSRIADVLANADIAGARKVHEVRKGAKKLRSLIRLVAPVVATAKPENTVLRDAARSLSSVRDSGAIEDSLARLKLPVGVGDVVELALADRREPSLSPGEPAKLLKVFNREMRAVAKRVAGWQIDADDFEAVRPGLKRSYKKLREDFAKAIHSGEEEATHDWRKSAKTHWHHTLMLSQICPEAMDAHARMASRLSESLGNWRDSGLLIAALEALPPGNLEKDTLKIVSRAAMRDQKRLLKKAQRISALLTAEKPQALIARWSAYWSATID